MRNDVRRQERKGERYKRWGGRGEREENRLMNRYKYRENKETENRYKYNFFFFSFWHYRQDEDG